VCYISNAHSIKSLCFARLAAVGVPSIFPVLHKARIDNMKDYIEKKRLRLAAEKQKEQKDEKTSTDVDTDRVLPT